MIDDRVWTVRFRREIADQIRQIAEHEHLTVQQVIIRAVERMLDPRPADVPSTPGSSDHDIYQYGGGAASNV